jgi:hypothetical protein
LLARNGSGIVAMYPPQLCAVQLTSPEKCTVPAASLEMCASPTQ